MLKNKQIKKNIVVFSQWSRKGYAIFASLKSVVKIGCLTIDLCESALSKSSSSIQFVRTDGIDENESIDPNSSEFALNPVLIASNLPLVCNNVDTYHQSKRNNYTIRKPIFCHVQNMGFLFLYRPLKRNVNSFLCFTFRNDFQLYTTKDNRILKTKP